MQKHNPRAPKQGREVLMEALAMLDHFTTPDDPKCAVDPAAREAGRLYLDTWVGGPLRAAINYLDGYGWRVDWTTGQ